MGWKINLTNIEGKETSEHSFSEPFVRFGRDPKNEITISHPRISRLHCTLSERDKEFFLQDSSRNGVLIKVNDQWTKVNGEIGVVPPVELMLPNWMIEAEYVPDPVDEGSLLDDTQVWDQSVIIPAGRLGHFYEAILVFDLCESSLMASRDDNMAYHMKRRLTQIAEPVLSEFHRRFFKSTGDGFLATFESSREALLSTIEIENRIQQRNKRTNNPPIHYRLALHFGETWAIAAGGEDIHGNDVNITFRIEGVQTGAFTDPKVTFPARDRILCSDSFLSALSKEHEGNVTNWEAVECGPAVLKGIEKPIDIHWFITQYSNRDDQQDADSVDWLAAD